MPQADVCGKNDDYWPPATRLRIPIRPCKLYPYLGLHQRELPRRYGAFCPSARGKKTGADVYETAALGWPGRDGPTPWVFTAYNCYGIGAYLGALPNGVGSLRVSNVANPSITFYAKDSFTAWIYALWFSVPTYRHGGSAPAGVSGYDQLLYRAGGVGFNAVMCDGHTEWIPMQQYANFYLAGPEYFVRWRTY